MKAVLFALAAGLCWGIGEVCTKSVLHSGKVGPLTAIDELEAFGREGVLAMVADSTNILNPGKSGSEAEVRESLTGLIGRISNRVVVTNFG